MKKKLILAISFYIMLLIYCNENCIKVNTLNSNFSGEMIHKELDLSQVKTFNEIANEKIEEYKEELRQEEIKQKKIQEEKARLERIRLEKEKQKRVLKIKLTGYCNCSICCGEWSKKNYGINASGTVSKFGTIAAPKSIPFGTKMKIEGYGNKVFIVEDTGSAVVQQRNGVYVIDMWMPTHEQAWNIGNKIVTATIIN